MNVKVVESDDVHISTKADTFWLDLSHLRAVVAAADEAGVPDKADVTFEGMMSSVIEGRWHAQRIIVKHSEPKR